MWLIFPEFSFFYSISTDDRLRIEKLDSDRFDPTQALQTVTQFYKTQNMASGRCFQTA